MRVVLTVNAAWNVLNFRRPLVDYLLAAGHHVTVLAPPDGSEDALRQLGCAFVPLPMNAKGLSPLDGVRLVRQFKRHFRDLDPEIVLSFTIKNNLFGAVAARSLGIPFIPNVTGLGTAFLSGRALQMVAEGLYRYCFRHLPVVFFQNEDDRDLFLSRGLIQLGQARLLPGSGIDLTRFSVTPLPGQDNPVFLMVARLIRDKGVLEYAQAAAIVKRQFPNAQFRILGPLGAENRSAIPPEIVASWSPDTDLDYLGETSDVRPHIEAADCVVLPSYREGAPRTLIEAAAMGRALIATDVPGCRAVVQDEITGFLCGLQDAQSLADACTQFVQLTPEQRRSMGLTGRQKMEREYDQSIVVQAYDAAIQDVRN
ncbi:MAG: glycosyltransferase family 4 protein [Thalassovita sp.]